jgi:putative restriction endonuclease
MLGQWTRIRSVVGSLSSTSRDIGNTTPPAPIRDLYGTMLHEGATKEILVTTAEFGPSAQELATGNTASHWRSSAHRSAVPVRDRTVRSAIGCSSSESAPGVASPCGGACRFPGPDRRSGAAAISGAQKAVSAGRQVTFLPVETLLCLAASFLVNHWRFGGSTAHLAPEPVPTLARLFSRPPSSVLAKMANLDGSRSHGGKWDILAGAMLREDSTQFADIYRVLLHAARAEGIDRASLPDFPRARGWGEFALLGQDELGTSVFENALKDQIARSVSENDWPAQDTERIILAAARVGQHVFALNMLNNCGRWCVFCSLNPSAFGVRRMLLAGHIKPWKDSSAIEWLDPRNGLAACPSHDVAFDKGMLTESADLKIHIAQPLADVARGDHLTRQSTVGRRSWRLCCFPMTLSVPGANTSTGTVRRSSSPDRSSELGR